MERDIIRGRKAMNFDLWNNYGAEQQQTLAAKIAKETRERQMPLLQYRMIHWRSGITNADIEILANWAHGLQGPATAGFDQPNVDGDPARGKALFEKRCTGCHSLTQNREGPQLQGVYGRTSGTVAGYAYSPGLKAAHIVWNEKSLGKWLTDPDASIPGNNMDFLVSNPQERADLISFLKQISVK
jgi:cytochrome c